jgi:hypothetical protein
LRQDLTFPYYEGIQARGNVKEVIYTSAISLAIKGLLITRCNGSNLTQGLEDQVVRVLALLNQGVNLHAVTGREDYAFNDTWIIIEEFQGIILFFRGKGKGFPHLYWCRLMIQSQEN